MISLVLGGTRSGKSAAAERRATAEVGPEGALSYVATAVVDGSDPDLEERVKLHRARRPAHWSTIEVGLGGDLVGVLASCGTAVLVDSLGTWVAGLPGFGADSELLTRALVARRRIGLATIVVSDEVGLGVHPSTADGLSYRDALGEVNRAVGEVAAEVLLVVAGRVLPLPPLAT